VGDDATLPRLVAMAFRALIDDLHHGLRQAGYELRPAQGFALVAVGENGTTASRLAEVMGITKQGTAKLVDGLVDLGYLTRESHAEDGRARLLVLTARGRALLAESVRIQRRIEADWAATLGDGEMLALRRALEQALARRYPGELPPIRPAW
jgi:DNA-binding MarR family transcriptional regulator